MTTPPITIGCQFCGAPESLAAIDSEQRHGRFFRFVSCRNCTARGPDNAYDDECRQIAAAVFDWNTRASAREWRTNGAAVRLASRRAAFIDKWSFSGHTPTTTTNHQPKGKTTTP